MTDNGNENHAAETVADPPINRQQRRAAEAEARKAGREAAPMPPAPPSADWLVQQIGAQEQTVNLVLAQMTATEIYQAYMREVGVLNWLREKQAAQTTGTNSEE